MSSSVHKYHICYEDDCGFCGGEYIYCKFEHVGDTQSWCTAGGTSLNFDCLTDNHAFVLACCIAGYNTGDKDFDWKEIKDFTLPDEVAKFFGYLK